MRYFLCFLIIGFMISTALYSDVDFSSKDVIEARYKESLETLEKCKNSIKFYDLKEGQSYRDITEELMMSEDTHGSIKEIIFEQRRRFVVFSYPSDGLKIKGYISYTQDHEKAPLIIHLRGGTGIFGLLNPANDYSCINNYTTISTTYRGGVSEGEDEYGGDDVNDVLNLITYISKLEKDLSIKLSNNRYIIGCGRGGTQMFLALQRYPFIQAYFNKAICVSGFMDLYDTISNREDMKNMFINDFGLTFGINDEEWLKYRSPIFRCDKIKKSMPLLLIYSSNNPRAHVDHGRKMHLELKRLENDVTYWEFEDRLDFLDNRKKLNLLEMIGNWIEEN